MRRQQRHAEAGGDGSEGERGVDLATAASRERLLAHPAGEDVAAAAAKPGALQ
jgi:hypothetical protein